MLDDEVGAMLETDSSSKSRLDLLRHSEVVEDGNIAFVELDNRFSFWCNKADITLHLLKHILIVDVDAFVGRVEEVT